MEALSKGLSNKEIGEELLITERTIKAHIRQICSMLGIRRANRVRLIYYWNCQLFQIGMRELELL